MSYTAAVLTPSSQKLLKDFLEELVPNTWEYKGHHCTLNMGTPLDPSLIGKTVSFTIDKIAKDEKVIAVSVCDGGEISSNKIPHVTIAVNREGGGKPFMSNNLTGWKPLDELIDVPYVVLTAVVQICD